MELMCAVQHCHEHGIAHRDIKLSNILLDNQFHVKLVGFQLAIRAPNRVSLERSGTLSYMAPEVLQGSDRSASGYDPFAADIWSCGVVLFSMLAGRRPFDASDAAQTRCRVLSGSYNKLDGFSDSAQDLIRGMLAVDPAHRPVIDRVLDHPWMRAAEARPSCPA